jgi:putative membrane protein
MKAFWKIIALLIGLALFGWYLSRTDLRAVAEVLSRLGWLAPLALIPYLIVYIVDCIGWRFCLPSGLKIPFFVLFCIRWAGEAVNNVLPSGYVGGEAVKVYLLRRRAVPADTGTTSVVVGRSAQTTAQLLYIGLASIALMQLAAHQPGLRPALLMILTCATAVLVALFWIQSRGLFACTLAVFRVLRLKLAWIEHRRAKILELDHAITGFYSNHRSRFFASTAFYFGGWLLDTLEVYLVAYLLGMPITWPQALAVEAFTSVVKIIGLWVPGTIGVQESGILMLGRLAGLPDTLSVAYALIRRAREVIFAGIGWLLLYADHASLRKIKAESSPGIIPATNVSSNP